MMGKDALNPKPPKIWASRAFPLQTRPNHEARETSPAFLTRHSPSNSCLSVQFFMSSQAHHNPIASSEGKILSDTSQIDIMNYASHERGAHELLIDSWAFQSLELEQLLGFPTLYCMPDGIPCTCLVFITYITKHLPLETKQKKRTQFDGHCRGNSCHPTHT